MNKNELIDNLSNKCGMTKADATRSVECVLDCITAELKGGGEVRLVGFGTFSVYQRAATQARNPRTGEPVQIPASTQPKFKAGKALKEAVNQ